MLRRLTSLVLGCAVLGLGLAPAAGAAALRRDLVPGDVLRDHGVAVVVPPRGRRIYAEQWLRSGGVQQLRVTTRPDGSVWVRSMGDDSQGASAGDGEHGTGCEDAAHSLGKHKWVIPYAWSFRAASTPLDLSTAGVEATLISAARNITTERSPCTNADEVSAEQLYLGDIAPGTDIASRGSLCEAHAERDHLNVVDFGELPADVLGMSCTWSTLRLDSAPVVALESDIRLNKHDNGWFTTLLPGCNDEYSIEGVMTHEFGHTFGLGHVAEDRHANQTMSTHINGPCQRSEVTLGLGDALGLRAMY
jgi:hypothetical protein